jgi:hypothetical protein
VIRRLTRLFGAARRDGHEAPGIDREDAASPVNDVHAHVFVPEVRDLVKDTPLGFSGGETASRANALGSRLDARLAYMDAGRDRLPGRSRERVGLFRGAFAGTRPGAGAERCRLRRRCACTSRPVHRDGGPPPFNTRILQPIQLDAGPFRKPREERGPRSAAASQGIEAGRTAVSTVLGKAEELA